MSTVRERAVENAEQIFVSLVLGAGFVAMFADFDFFWMIWILGFAVFLPLIGAVTGKSGDESAGTSVEHDTRSPNEHSSADTDPTSDALATLRDRYARGDLTDEQFEHKLDALLETESPENAAEWRTRDQRRERIDERT